MIGELARLFLWLGVVSFGGPAAHIALMRHEVVEKRRWLSDRDFLDLVGATNLIPGPNSTELAIHIGLLRGGLAGLLVAGLSFIVPAVVIVGAIAMAYTKFGSLPEIQAVFAGVKPVVIAIVAHALYKLARAAVRVPWHGAIAITACVAAAMAMNELALLAACGALGGVIAGGLRNAVTKLQGLMWVPAISAPAAVASAVSLTGLFTVFLKAGGLLFGSGYVLLAFLRADLVERLHWLSEQQLLDAIAIGQVTPGPVFTTATFIGYQLAGVNGALVATLGIFLPAFVYVAISGPLLPKLKQSPIATGVLDGVNLASLALMAVVCWQLGRNALVDLTSIALALVSLSAIVARLNPTWLIALGILVGLIRHAH